MLYTNKKAKERELKNLLSNEITVEWIQKGFGTKEILIKKYLKLTEGTLEYGFVRIDMLDSMLDDLEV